MLGKMYIEGAVMSKSRNNALSCVSCTALPQQNDPTDIAPLCLFQRYHLHIAAQLLTTVF